MTKKKWTKLEIGKFFQKHINLLLENSDTIINNPNLYYVNIPHLTILNDIQDIHVSVYLGTLLQIWNNKQMIIPCPECNSFLHIYFLRLKHYLTRNDIQNRNNEKTSEAYGTCLNCDNLIIYQLSGDDRFSLMDISIPYSIVVDKKDKMYHQSSSITPNELIEKLSIPEQDSYPLLPWEEAIIIKKSNLPEEELKQMKIDTYRYVAYHKMTVMEHLSFHYKTDEEKEKFIQRRVNEMIDNNF